MRRITHKGLSFMDIRTMGAYRRIRARLSAWADNRARLKRINQLAKPGARISDIDGAIRGGI